MAADLALSVAWSYITLFMLPYRPSVTCRQGQDGNGTGRWIGDAEWVIRVGYRWRHAGQAPRLPGSRALLPPPRHQPCGASSSKPSLLPHPVVVAQHVLLISSSQLLAEGGQAAAGVHTLAHRQRAVGAGLPRGGKATGLAAVKSHAGTCKPG